jgi:hypothetical protein
MKSDAGIVRMAAFFPHPEAARTLHDLREKLFARGAAGAYDLPPCLPLSFPDRPLNRRELRELADSLRDGGSRFTLASPAAIPAFAPFGTPFVACALSGTTLGGGPMLLVAPVGTEAEGRAVLSEADGDTSAGFPLVFTAAFVANAVFRRADADASGQGSCAEWARGEGVWIPSPRRIGEGGRRADVDQGVR